MKKTTTLMLTVFATLLLFAAATGCVKDDNHYYFYGYVTFWNNDASLSSILVTVDNSQQDYIDKYTVPSYCNQDGYATFYLVEGYHTWSARTVRGTPLGSGSFNVSRDCDFFEIY